MQWPKNEKELTHDLIRELFYYHADGVLVWRKRVPSLFNAGRKHSAESVAKFWNTQNAGKIAGTKNGDGYIMIPLGKYRKFSAHRIVWNYFHGIFPSQQLDHKNGDRADNRIENLREATAYQNAWNVKIRKSNRTGVTGVSVNKRNNTFSAHITANGKIRFLGSFQTVEEAAVRRKCAEEELHGAFSGSKRGGCCV